jgi:tetratricopeptide (TPR) repeat protein
MAARPTGVPPPGGGPNLPFESLTPEEHRILAYASAIGSEFDFALLLGAMGVSEEALAEELERLVHLRVLTERAGGERFAFTEEEFRARIYRSLTESRLRVLHRKIGEVLERMYPEPTLPVLAELGRHYFLGKVPAKSYEFNRRAAEAAKTAGEFQLAAHHLERVLLDLSSLPGDRHVEQAEVEEELGGLEYHLGDYDHAETRFREALDRIGAAAPGIRARLLIARAEVLRERLDFDTAIALAAEARRLFESVGNRQGAAGVHHLIARIDFRRGAYRDSVEQCMQALDLARGATEDPLLIGSIAIELGNAFSELGPEVRDVAIAWYERAVDLLRPTGDLAELARAYLNLGVDVGEARPQDGIEILEKAQQAYERARDARGVARALVATAELRLSIGQIDEAERDNEHVGHILEHLADELGRAWVEANRGLIAERRGLWEEAERAFERDVELCRKFQLPGDEAEGAFYLARLRYKTRDLDGARQAFAIATDLDIVNLRPHLAEPYLELGQQLGIVPAASPPASSVGPADTASMSDKPPL